MDFRVLGPLEAFGEHGKVDLGGPKPRAVLGVLLLHANEPVSAERLAIALEGENAPPRAPKRVQVHVSRLRKALGDGDILTREPAGYRLRVRPEELDAERFRRLFEDGRRALAAGQTERAASVLREALALWRGPPLAELAFDPFEQAEIARLEELRLNAVEACVEAELALGRHAALVGELQQLVADNPTRERLAGQLMLALYRCGRQAEALETYREARSRLVEVGLEPGPELRRLQMAILRQDESLEAPAAVPDLPRELDAATAPPLVGRDAELAWLRERWEQARDGEGALITVTGERGIGKTRLAAELAGEVHREGATVLYASGAGPPEAMLAALGQARDATHPTLLVVDGVHEAHADVLAKLNKLTSVRSVTLLALVTAQDAAALAPLHADGSLGLEPLDVEAARAIAARYAPRHPTAELPAEWLLAAGRGIPRRVHELARQWARREAARRVGAVAGRASAGRVELRAIEAELADDVVELQAAGEQSDVEATDPGMVICPFKGLASFDVGDADFFFGRERLTAEMVARLAGSPLLGVIGPSGSGKSSAVRAGLLPALAKGTLPQSETWPVAVVRPGQHPLAALDEATRVMDPRRRLVIAVDQFEETFTLCRDEAERRAFIDALVAWACDPKRRAAVIVALRADFYGRCAAYPELSRLLGANHLLVGPMQRDELRRAIELPARRAGLWVEPALVDRLLADVEGEPGALPLLSTALLELWQHRDGRRLTVAVYKATGGVQGAVARLAEAAYERLEPEQRPMARSLLLRLAGDGEGSEAVRCRVPLEDLHPKTAPVLAVLTDARLVTVSEGTAEVAHEALLREWPRLRGWLEEDVEGRRLHHHLAGAAHEWDEGGRDPTDLYRGTRLAASLEWAANHDDQLNPLERAFLDASEARRQRERTVRRRRLRLAFAGLTTALVAITVVAVVAVYQGREADRQRDIATSRALAANAMSTLTGDPGLSLALARRAVAASPTAEATAALRQAVLDFRALAVMRAARQPVYGVALTRDGRRAVSASRDGKLRIWNVADGRAILTTRVHRDHAYSPSFSPDERWVASGGGDGIVAVTEVASGRRRVLIRHPGEFASTVAFAPDGKLVAGGYTDGSIRVAETNGDGVRVLDGHRNVVAGVAFSEDGRRLASASWDGTVRVWDLRESRDVLVLRSNRQEMGSIDFSPDGRRLIAGDGYGWISVWSVPGGNLEKKIRAGDKPLYAARFSADGQRIATAGDDGVIRVIDARSGRVTALLRGHSGTTFDARFNAKGDLVISAGRDGTVRLWDPGTTRVIRAPVSNATFSADGQRLVAGGTDGVIRLWGTDGRLDRELHGHTSQSWARWSPDGGHVISASLDGTVRIWSASGGRPQREFRDNGRQAYAASFDRRARRFVSGGWNGRVVVRSLTGKPTVLLRGNGRAVWDVAFDPTDRRVVSAGDDGTIRIWDVQRASRPVRVLRGHHGAARAVAFSRDGGRVASAGDDGTVRVWSLSNGHNVVLRGHEGPVYSVAFNPRGDRVVSAGFGDGSVRLWDPRGGPPLVTLHQYRHTASSATFSPDGSHIVSAGDDNTIRLSTCEVCGSLDSVLRLAGTRMERPFSLQERQRFLAAAN